MDADTIKHLMHMQDAIATGRSNRHFRIDKRHGMAIRKSNMEGGAAADVIWSRGECCTGDAAWDYMEMLDLGSGSKVVAEFERVWPGYGEAVRNRKRSIAELAAHYIGPGIRQIVVLGAGLDALPIEIAEHSGYAVSSYEVDAATMPYKRLVMDKMRDRSAAGCVRCITANLSSMTARRLGTALRKEGWDGGRPSLVVAEGVTQYLPKSKLGALLSAFRTPGRSSRIVMEYVRNAASIPRDWAPIPEAVFGWHGRMIGVDSLSRYSDAQALDFAAGGTGRGGKAGVAAAAAAGMSIVDPAMMEKARTGANAVFPNGDSGWSGICHGPI